MGRLIQGNITLDTLAELKAQTPYPGMLVKTLGYASAFDGGGGRWVFDSSDLSTEVAADTQSGVYAPPDSDATGASGAWVRPEWNGVHAKWFGATFDGVTDDYTALNAFFQFANANNVIGWMPVGTALISDQIAIVRPQNDLYGIKINGASRGLTKIGYTGAGSPASLLSIDGTSSGWALNNELRGFKLDLDGSPAGTHGLIINAGIWRSRFEDLYVVRSDASIRTGSGIYMGSSTPADVGCFDNKFGDLYVVGFDKNLEFVGTDLSGNTVTNTVIERSYISGGNYNLHASYTNGLHITGTQLENAYTGGAHFIYGETVNIMGGTIESAQAGATGITMDANTKSVVALCDFYNNAGGSFVTNNEIGHLYKTAQSGFVYPSGSEIRIDSDGTNDSYIRFFRNGVADGRIKVGESGNTIDWVNSSDAQIFSFDITNRSFKINNGTAVSGFYSYHGSPEGNLSANVGSYCMDTANGDGYIKATGTGNTGWALVTHA